MADPSRGTGPGGGPLEPGKESPWAEGEAAASPTLLLSMVLVIATAGLVYELVMAAVASYVLGDSVRHFSLVIRLYLSALGAGAYLSRFAGARLGVLFVDVELAVAIVGGLSAPALFLAFGFTASFSLILFSFVLITGILVGIELPLLMRVLEKRVAFKDLIARALTFDYAGALVGSLAFSLLLVPHLGLARSSVVCGLLNALVGLASTFVLPAVDAAERRGLQRARWRAALVTVLLAVALTQANRAAEAGEATLYPGRVAVQLQSPYQRIVVVEQPKGAFELYLDGNLQFSSVDEYRYHEALVHPALAAARVRRQVLIGGGGDGLAAREVLKWPDIERVTVVDLDEAVTRLARTYAPLVQLNRAALNDSRVELVHSDAMRWLARTERRFDVMIFDFPDPSNYSLGKLYSRTLYRSAKSRLAPGGAIAVQASSPFFARKSFWCVVTTLESVGFSVEPYHAYVPSFGDWGFALAQKQPFSPSLELPPAPFSFLSEAVLPTLFWFPADTGRVPTEPNRLNNQALVGYYLDEWIR